MKTEKSSTMRWIQEVTTLKGDADLNLEHSLCVISNISFPRMNDDKRTQMFSGTGSNHFKCYQGS